MSSCCSSCQNNTEKDVVSENNHLDRNSTTSQSNSKRETIKLFILLGLSIVVLVFLIIYHHTLPIIYQYILFAPFYIILGMPVFINAFKDFRNGHFMRESFLMSIATVGAMVIGELPEALAVLVFYRFGEYFEELGEVKSRSAIKSLMATKAEYANKIVDSKTQSIEQVSVESLKKGDAILIKPSEKVPADCIITSGASSVDTRTLTGESIPRYVEAGDNLLATMINMEGLLYATVEHEYSQSSISRILKLVQSASSKKTNLEKFISRFAGIYTPIIVLIATLLTVVPVFIFKQDFSTYLMRSFTLLVISCPCAFVVGIPLTYFSAIGRFAKMGIVFKGGVFIDVAANIKNVVFDKTGTLTTGIFYVTDINIVGSIDRNEFIKYAALAEASSLHPIAKSITSYYRENFGDIDNSMIKDYKEIAARGASATIGDKAILVGNQKLMVENGIDISSSSEKHDASYSGIVYVAIDGKYKGNIIISDTIKTDTKTTIAKLKNMHVHTTLLSGDKQIVVQNFASEIGIDEARAELMPDEKLYNLETIIKEQGTTAFVGDGINDAPSLARSDVGIAMGALSTDAATENADIIIMDDNPKKVIDIIKGAKLSKGVVVQNMLFAFVIKVVILVLSIFGITSMWAGVFADTGVTVIVILNALRLLATRSK